MKLEDVLKACFCYFSQVFEKDLKTLATSSLLKIRAVHGSQGLIPNAAAIYNVDISCSESCTGPGVRVTVFRYFACLNNYCISKTLICSDESVKMSEGCQNFMSHCCHPRPIFLLPLSCV